MNPAPAPSDSPVARSQPTDRAEPRRLASVAELPSLDGLDDPVRYLSRHSRSFRFSATMMARSDRARVARVYAWCRYTDNLVDDDVGTDLAERRLDGWLRLSWDAYDGRDCGVELVNRVMGEMAEREIPFAYPHDLVRAMRSDLHFVPYADLDALRVYTYRAAGVVGRWLTELHGVRDAWMLERATALGQAMQLTNILRDVGEDLERGRLYLPSAELRRVGLTGAELDAMRHGARGVSESFRRLMESLMEVANADYDLATQAIPRLPSEFRRAAAVAGAVYQAIHGAIRRIGYETLRRRAYATLPRKLLVATGALVGLARSRVTTASRTAVEFD